MRQDGPIRLQTEIDKQTIVEFQTTIINIDINHQQNRAFPEKQTYKFTYVPNDALKQNYSIILYHIRVELTIPNTE